MHDERYKSIRLMVIGLISLAAAFGMWWLVESTNREGDHDAQLLPLLALIPLGIGALRYLWDRHQHHIA